MGDRDPTENEAAERDGRPTRLTLRSHHYHIGFDRYYNGHIYALQCITLKVTLDRHLRRILKNIFFKLLNFCPSNASIFPIKAPILH